MLNAGDLPVTVNVGLVGYVIAVLAYAVLTALLLSSWKRGWVGAALISATVLTALWALAEAAVYAYGDAYRAIAALLEVLEGAAWLVFMAGVLANTAKEDRNPRTVRMIYGAIGTLFAVVVATDISVFALGRNARALFGFDYSILGRLIIAVAGILIVENLYRNTKSEQRWEIKYICLGVGAVFTYEFFMFSDGLLFQNVNPALVDSRGFVTAVIVPLIAVSAARNPHWAIEVAVSRKVIFHSATLVGAGIYLLLMAAAGFYLREFGGEWGPAVQVVFLFAAIILLILTLFSGSFRVWVKLNVNKYFFTYRYDYREEWLRLIGTISSVGSGSDLPERVIKAVADIVGSPEGTLWIRRDGDSFEMVTSWHGRVLEGLQSADPAFVAYLEERNWIINLNEYRDSPDAYGGLVIPDWVNDLRAETRAWLIVPLLHHDSLFGILMLGQPRIMRTLNWEDYDLLKTVGRQCASYLAERDAVRALLEARQFDQFNRRFAFVLHDIKNLVSQLSIMVKNSEKHRDNPEFQEDMVQTVSESVQKMNNLLVRLHEGGKESAATTAVNVSEFLQRVVDRSTKGKDRLKYNGTADSIAVAVDEERLGTVMAHIIDNALDAIDDDDGRVEVRFRTVGHEAVIEVEDNGCGMSKDFIRDELFKPFHSSKSTGYGIGAYESRAYVRDQGGSMDVQSELGVGTKISIRLPAITLAGQSN